MSKEPIKKQPVSEKKLDEAYDALNVLHWETLTRRSEARRILDHLRYPVERAREAGASWPVIAAQIEKTAGYKISVPTIRSFFKNEAVKDKDQEKAEKNGEMGLDLSQKTVPNSGD